MRIIKTKKRTCDCCGSRDLEEIWSYSMKTKTKNDISQWNVRNVICRKCGFVFVSPCPTQQSLNSHYMDSFEHSANQNPDFSLQNRLGIIRRLCRPGRKSSYIEIGSNKCPDFISSLSKLVGSISTVEINQSCTSSYDRIDGIRKTFDIVAAYFVLEHIPNPEEFLSSCREMMNDKGRLILEVPDVYLYPRDRAGLLLCEHVNHFSPVSLGRIAAQAGLEMVEISHGDCSRPFGFLAIFRRAGRKIRFKRADSIEYMLAKSCMLDGKKTIDSIAVKNEADRDRIRSLARRRKDIIFWAANINCMKFIEGLKPLPSTICIVDSDPYKKDYFPGITVHTPSEIIDRIKDASHLVICTPFYAEDIRRWIKEKTGRLFDKNDSTILTEVI